ncbi:MAG: CDP-diacylglycerol--serine O-phosphatidyltransferase [Acidobacteria bacterium]|nr:CDP-diacylglycerol--serine O-phosphatidyltransferase [Acidobacteriota bacterium]
MSEHTSHPQRRARRGIYILPSFFTVGNLLCGYYSILSSARGTVGDLDTAAKAIGIAVVLDGLDGRVARMSKATSPFGKEFDSLADVISFGIAPAFLALAWGLRGLDPSAAGNPNLVQHIYQLGWVATFAFVICGAWRLARFNIQATETANMGPPAHRYFVGMPIPAAAGVIAAVVHAVQEPITEWSWAAAWLVLVSGLAYLMVSPIRYYSFKEIGLGRSELVIIIGLLVWLILLYSRVVLLLVAVSYLLSGLIVALRRRFVGAAT